MVIQNEANSETIKEKQKLCKLNKNWLNITLFFNFYFNFPFFYIWYSQLWYLSTDKYGLSTDISTDILLLKKYEFQHERKLAHNSNYNDIS